MSEHERQRVVNFPDPPAEGTRQRLALDLRIARKTYSEIAAEMGVAIQTAHEYVHAAIERMSADEVRHADVARQMHLLRLDALLAAQWPRAMQGDVTAAVTCLRIMEREAKLLGLDAPVKVDVEHRLRALATEHGLDPDEAVEEVRAIMKALPKG